MKTDAVPVPLATSRRRTLCARYALIVIVILSFLRLTFVGEGGGIAVGILLTPAEFPSIAVLGWLYLFVLLMLPTTASARRYPLAITLGITPMLGAIVLMFANNLGVFPSTIVPFGLSVLLLMAITWWHVLKPVLKRMYSEIYSAVTSRHDEAPRRPK